MMLLNHLKMIDSINLFKWFLDNQMKANSDKCHLSPVSKVVRI